MRHSDTKEPTVKRSYTDAFSTKDQENQPVNETTEKKIPLPGLPVIDEKKSFVSKIRRFPNPRATNDGKGRKKAIFVDPKLLDEHDIDLTGLNEKWKSLVPGHRDQYTVVTSSPHGRPVTVRTPGGTDLERSKDYQLFVTLVERNDAHTIPSHPSLKYELKTPEKYKIYSKLHAAPENGVRRVHVTLTKDLVAENRKELKESNNRRYPSQQQVMAKSGKISAEDAAKLTAAYDPASRKEWYHTTAVRFLGNNAQKVDYLVSATAAANVDAAYVEEFINLQLNFYHPKPIEVDTEVHYELNAHGLPGYSHVAKTIIYTITNPDKKVFVMTVDPKTTEFPAKSIGVYFADLASSIVRKPLAVRDLTKEMESEYLEVRGI